MKLKHIFPLVLILAALAGCKQGNVRISGEIDDAGKSKVYLEQLNVDNTKIIDSVTANRKGKFSFRTNITEPTFYNVRIGKNENMPLVAVPDEKIHLTGTMTGLSGNYWVDGSENSLWLKLLNFQLNKTRVAMDSLKKTFAAVPEGEAYNPERLRLLSEWDTVTTRQMAFSRDFILKHGVSPAAYYALYQKFDKDNFVLDPGTDLHYYKIVASSLKAMYPESQYTKAILKHLSEINKAVRNQKLLNLIANSESSIPEIKLPDSNGDSISLRSLKGKYIILDFTVLGGKEGKTYIDEMKKFYDKYRNKGVEVYQVCLDPNYLQWQNLVKQYGITWKCVWDADGERSRPLKTWNIQNLPANYIINPKSEIVGKNLPGQRLADRMNDLMKQ